MTALILLLLLVMVHENNNSVLVALWRSRLLRVPIASFFQDE